MWTFDWIWPPSQGLSCLPCSAAVGLDPDGPAVPGISLISQITGTVSSCCSLSGLWRLDKRLTWKQLWCSSGTCWGRSWHWPVCAGLTQSPLTSHWSSAEAASGGEHCWGAGWSGASKQQRWTGSPCPVASQVMSGRKEREGEST